ncbi:MAG: hypothetical protein ACLFTT_03185 [Candidatus Hydrogenedentota bacterium]
MRITTIITAVICLALVSGMAFAAAEDAGLRVTAFDMNVTPPVGSEMAYDPVIKHWDQTLRARGIVLLGADEPIVVCAVDWIGIGNEAHDAFRAELAEAAGTMPERVTVHALHQHDSPMVDFTAERILKDHGIAPGKFDGTHAREVLQRLKTIVADSLEEAQPVTHVGTSSAKVEKVASNRRILGEDGKVRAVRFTSCRDPKIRAEPEGIIDPELDMVSLWNGEEPLAVLTYYATHPQSYYRNGIPNPDFPGVARFLRQMTAPDALHVHFTGAGGNIGAGKYNDGSKENRLKLAKRVADAMARAWEATERTPVTADDVAWKVAPVALPVGKHIVIEELEEILEKKPEDAELLRTARNLAWARRRAEGHKIDVSCLAIGPARMLHLPAELFVEYQLAAKSMRPDLHVAMAAYGDYAPGYICTTIAYEQGGYEASDRVSRVAPEVEPVLMAAIEELLEPAS